MSGGQSGSWREPGGSKPGRAVPDLGRQPGERAVRVYRALVWGAPAATDRRRHAQVTRLLAELAVAAGCSVPTVKRSVAALERAGWLRRARQSQPGRRGGRLRGRCRFELIMPADVAAGLLLPSSQRGITDKRRPAC